jgi:hypothetical protein
MNQAILRVFGFCVVECINSGKPSFGLGSSASYRNELKSHQYDLIINGSDIERTDIMNYVKVKLNIE